jgi:hypothetical protein
MKLKNISNLSAIFFTVTLGCTVNVASAAEVQTTEQKGRYD